MTRPDRCHSTKKPSPTTVARPLAVKVGRTFARRYGPPLGFLVSAAVVVVLSFAALRGLGCESHDAAKITASIAWTVPGLARGEARRAR